MELTQVNNSNHVNVNNLNFLRSQKVENTDLNSIQNQNSIDKVEAINPLKSSLSLSLSTQVSRVSTIQIAQSEITNAIKIASNFEKVVTTNRNSLDNVQPQIQNFINIFNSSTANINKIIEEKGSDESRAYFDGILGSKPISGQEIFEAISKQQQNLERYNKELNNQLAEITSQTKTMFVNEKAQLPSIERNIDFKAQSVVFEAKVIQNQNGSITQTQANGEPKITTELLAAS